MGTPIASMRGVEGHLDKAEWIPAIVECGRLLEAILKEIYRRIAPHLPQHAKNRIHAWELSNQTRPGPTLGGLLFIFRDAGLFKFAENRFERPLPQLIATHWTVLLKLRNDAAHEPGTATRGGADLFVSSVAAFMEELGWEEFHSDPTHALQLVHPFELFKGFENLELFARARRYDRSDQQAVVSHLLLHSIQPAYYLGKLDVLDHYAKRIGNSSHFWPRSDLLINALAIVAGAYALYKGLKYHESQTYFENTKADLELCRAAPIDGTAGSWPEAIRLDFLGLCLFHLHLIARKAGDWAEADAYLRKAEQVFRSAIEEFEKLSVSPFADVSDLWLGYALRNLGAVLADIGEKPAARAQYDLALAKRERSYQRARQDCEPFIWGQLKAEIELVRIDIAVLQGERGALQRSTKSLLSMRHTLPSIWPHVEERLYESAIALNCPQTAELVVVTAVKDRLSRLVGETSACEIQSEVRSGSAIHAAVAARLALQKQSGAALAFVPGFVAETELQERDGI